MRKFKKLIIVFIILIVLLVGFFSLGSSKEETAVFGVNFSQKHSQYLGLDWKENYLAVLKDLGAKEIKLATYWDLIESKEGEYDFSDLDWQMAEAQKNNAKILLVIGMKTPRWPECHVPDWAKVLAKEEQQEKILDLLEELVLRYRDYPILEMWQVENEPFFPFGQCVWSDKDFLKKEIDLVKSLDKKPVIISDSGEGSLWISAAVFGDLVGTTMYEKVWSRQFKIYFTYPLPPAFYRLKAEAIERIFGKEVICVELQAEPWGPKLLYDTPLGEQEKTMNLEQFKKNVEFARKTGLRKFYLWGTEWWYWMKEVQGRPEIWQEAKKLF